MAKIVPSVLGKCSSYPLRGHVHEAEGYMSVRLLAARMVLLPLYVRCVLGAAFYEVVVNVLKVLESFYEAGWKRWSRSSYETD